jgi:hypothetical protein
MIVWGGFGDTSPLSSGGRYNPATDQWTSMSMTGAPGASNFPRGVWTGTELIVWPGEYSSRMVGARYNPATDSWRPMSMSGAPVGQLSSAVWTGTQMIVWGGYVAEACDSAEGGIYDPVTDVWKPMTTVGAPHPRFNHAAVWTGTQMIVWGGSNDSPNAASYDPVANAWFALSEVEAPSVRTKPALFFLPDLGTPGAGRMLLWGGGYTWDAATGAIYDFVPDQWGVVAPMPNAPSTPNLSASRTAVWTGTELIVWDVAVGLGGRYKP